MRTKLVVAWLVGMVIFAVVLSAVTYKFIEDLKSKSPDIMHCHKILDEAYRYCVLIYCLVAFTGFISVLAKPQSPIFYVRLSSSFLSNIYKLLACHYIEVSFKSKMPS